MIQSKSYWWAEAKKAAAIVGWFPTVILAQWQWETTYKVNDVWIPFASPNLLNNNNIAGQTWREWMPEFTKGSARPKAEGGYYIKYEDAVDGYTDFIKSNGRYANVGNETTEEGQIRAIAAAGWAADPDYAKGLISVLNSNKQQGYVWEVEEVRLEKWVAQTVVNTWLKPAWNEANAKGHEDDKKNIRTLGNKLRLACGMKEDEEFE